MSNTAEIIDALAAVGVRLTLAGGELIAEGKVRLIPPELAERIASHRDEIASWLADEGPAPPPARCPLAGDPELELVHLPDDSHWKPVRMPSGPAEEHVITRWLSRNRTVPRWCLESGTCKKARA